MAEKYCPTCRQEKSTEEFGLDKNRTDGLRSQCKTCKKAAYDEWRRQNPEKHRAASSRYNQKMRQDQPDKFRADNRRRALAANYDMTPQDYEEKYLAQKGLCAICGRPERVFDSRTNSRRNLAIDHNHMTGQIRDLLCGSCNTAIGKLEDSPELCRIAARYLETWEDHGTD